MTPRCYIIAEAGVNHNGSVERARDLVIAAKKAGADAVKFQTFKAERVALAGAAKAQYQLENTDPGESQIEMLRKLELPAEAHASLIALCREQGIDFLSTPYNEEDIDLLAGLGVTAFKFASIHVFEPALLRAAAHLGRPIILSTGMTTLADIDLAVRAIRAAGDPPLTLMQCTTNYPSRIEDANLRAITTMRAAFGLPVGYSDHTQSTTCCVAAIALGATTIEKHFTLDRSLPGPDHTSAAEPSEFASLVAQIRETEAALGSGRKEPCAAEIGNAGAMRRSIVARRLIAKGERITADMLTCKRPASGLSPQLIDSLLGRAATRDIAADAPLHFSMLAD